MDLNIGQLKARIEESATQRKRAAEASGGRFRLSQLNPRPGISMDLQEIRLSPEFNARRDHHYHVDDLLQFHDAEFVRNAYRAILKREPDKAGSDSHLEPLRSGRLNKIDILARLRFSSEGKQKNVTVDGLRMPALVRSLTRIPAIGYVCELVIGLLRLPAAIRHHRRFENHVNLQHQHLADYVNRLIRATREIEQSVAGLSFLPREVAAQREMLGAQETRLLEHDQSFINLSNQAEALTNHYEQLMAQMIAEQSRLASHSETLDRLHASFQQVKSELAAARARSAAISSMDPAQVSETKADEGLDGFFMSLEDRFRGERNELKKRFRFYLRYFEPRDLNTTILDVGCGRGEWLEVLQEAGFSAQGVDSNRLMIDQCRGRGLNVLHANAIDHLRGMSDNSLDGITAFHIIEHFDFAELVELIDQSIRTLRSGGVLILETPNPENMIVATRNFYLDPSHRRPLPSEFVEFLLDARGFTGIEVVKVHPLTEARVGGETELSNRFNDLFYGPMDYGVIARRI